MLTTKELADEAFFAVLDMTGALHHVGQPRHRPGCSAEEHAVEKATAAVALLLDWIADMCGSPRMAEAQEVPLFVFAPEWTQGDL